MNISSLISMMFILIVIRKFIWISLKYNILFKQIFLVSLELLTILVRKKKEKKNVIVKFFDNYAKEELEYRDSRIKMPTWLYLIMR